MKGKLIILLALFILSFTFIPGIEAATTNLQCQTSLDNSTWANIESIIYEGCADANSSLASIHHLKESTKYFIRCRNTTNSWAYISQRTDMGDKKAMGSLSVTLFMMFVTLGLYALPFVVGKFTKNPFSDLVFKRACWVLAIYLTMFTAAIMSTIAADAGLELTKEMFRMMWLFGTAGYIFMGYMVLRTLFDVMAMYKVKKTTEMMGEEEHGQI